MDHPSTRLSSTVTRCKLGERSGKTHVFLAEMAQGGWDPPYNHDARLLRYTTSRRGWQLGSARFWRRVKAPTRRK